jgi:hypothetical protein
MVGAYGTTGEKLQNVVLKKLEEKIKHGKAGRRLEDAVMEMLFEGLDWIYVTQYRERCWVS